MSGRSLDDLLAAIDTVEGWLSPDQAARLFAAAAASSAGQQIIEIGSFQGRSTVVLAGAAPDGVDVVAIDPHAGNDRGPRQISGFIDEAADDHDAFNANLVAAGVAERVRHIREFSHWAHDEVSGMIAVLYIDGAHRYAPALADIGNYGVRVTGGGTMLIHDSFSSIGVTLAILRALTFGSTFRYVGRSRSMTIYRADLPTSGVGRLRNAARQLAQLPWFARNVALKVLLTLGLGKVLGRLGRGVPEWPY
jgi:Methyltransferase domain